MEVKKDILWRVYLVLLFLGLFGIAIVAQIFRLQFVQGKYWRSKADSLTTAYKNIEAVRGNIYAADGSLLATSIPIFELRMDALAGSVTDEIFNRSVDSLSFLMSGMFKDKTAKEYRRELVMARKEGDRYHLVQKNVTYSQLKQIRHWPVFRMGKYKGGLIVLQRSIRGKPFRMLASRTIGYCMDNNQPVGLEGSYRSYLEGTSGKRLMQRISGNVWMPINSDNEIDPKDGSDLITTIDINIQDVAEHALLTQLSMHNAHHGCAVLMEVSTGEIRAIANLSRGEHGEYNEFYNYALGESTEPGSTFKLVSLIAAMRDGFVDPNDTVDTEGGAKRYYDRIIHDSHEGGYGKVSVQRAFEVSSNVGISKVIYQHYAKNPQAFVNNIRDMKLDQPLDLEIPGEARPYISDPNQKGWSGTSLPSMSIGYAVRFTPLQVLTFYNAVANGGTMVKPKFVKEIRHNGQLVRTFPVSVIKDSIATYHVIENAKQLLQGVVQNGTATNLKNVNYAIAGKTGTAKIARGNGGYKDSSGISYQASFVGYFPADNPKYSCIVVVNAPSNDVYYAAQVAGPIFKEIADKVYSSKLEIHKELEPQIEDSADLIPRGLAGYQYDIKRIYTKLGQAVETEESASEWVFPFVNKKSVTLKSRRLVEGIVPNVTGMALKDALYLLENAGLRVKVAGKGFITHQSVTPGTKVLKGMNIMLQLG